MFNVNNRVQIALPRLPDEVRRNGVIVQKRSFDILLVVSLVSPGKIGVFFIAIFGLQALVGIVAQPFVMGTCSATSGRSAD